MANCPLQNWISIGSLLGLKNSLDKKRMDSFSLRPPSVASWWWWWRLNETRPFNSDGWVEIAVADCQQAAEWSSISFLTVCYSYCWRMLATLRRWRAPRLGDWEAEEEEEASAGFFLLTTNHHYSRLTLKEEESRTNCYSGPAISGGPQLAPVRGEK